MKLNLKIWRQQDRESKGSFVKYEIDDITPDMSFLEMMDVLNQKLIYENIDPIAFDHDCREGICGSCSLFINGRAHGPDKGITTCQLHMRKFKDGDSIVIEPFRASSFPIIKDLVVYRSAFDRIQWSKNLIYKEFSCPCINIIQTLYSPIFNAIAPLSSSCSSSIP